MNKTVLVAAAMTLGALSAGAQGLSAPVAGCTTDGTSKGNLAQDACQQGYDVFQFMAPQLGLALAGGNATIGQGSTLGGLGHFSFGARLNVMRGALPDVTSFSQRTSGASPAQVLPAKDSPFGLPTADAAIGLFAGLPLALTNVGGVDLLVSAAYIPTYGDSTKDLKVTPKQNLQLGYGVRVGLLSESIVVPGVAITYLKRDLPTTTISGRASYTTALAGPTTANLSLSNIDVKTTAWRIVASKSLLILGVAAGYGQDKYDQGVDITTSISSALAGSSTTTNTGNKQSLTRTNYFVDASLNLLLLHVTGEIGQATGGTVNTFNSFSKGRADRSLTYASVGVRLGL